MQAAYQIFRWHATCSMTGVVDSLNWWLPVASHATITTRKLCTSPLVASKYVFNPKLHHTPQLSTSCRGIGSGRLGFSDLCSTLDSVGETMKNSNKTVGNKTVGGGMDKLMKTLEELQKATGNPELQTQAILTFCYVASRHPNEVSMGEIEKNLNLTQTTTSRNIGYWGDGAAGRYKGYGMFDVYFDPFYHRRKLVKLTPKGQKLAAKLAELVGD